MSQLVVRVLASLALGLASLLAAPAAHAIDSGDILVESVKGEVHVTMNGTARKVRAGSVLELPASVRTGRDGAIDLRQGATTVNVGPDTLLEFPVLEKRGDPVDRIIQPRGNAFYSIGKRPGRKLRVEAPYLVGVVKGTQFNVAAQDESTTISLFEGLLEVRATDDSDVVDLKAGEIASRKRGDPRISVFKMDPGKAPPTQRAPAGAGGGDGNNSGERSPGRDAAPARPAADDGETLRVDRQPAAPGSSGSLSGTGTVSAAPVTIAATVETHVDANSALARPNAADVNAATTVDAGAVSVGAGVSAGVDSGAVDATVTTNVNAGAASVDVGASATVDVSAGSISADTNVNAAVSVGNAAAVDAGVSAAVDVGNGAVSVDAGATVAVDAGNVAAVDTSVSAAVDVGNGAASVAVDTAAAVDVAGAATVDLGAAANVSVGADAASVAVDTAAAVDVAGAATVDLGAATNVDVGADAASVAVDTTAAVDVAGAATVDLGATSTVDVSGSAADVDLGAATTVDLGDTSVAAVDTGVAATVDPVAGDVTANVDLGADVAGVDTAVTTTVDAAAGSVDLGVSLGAVDLGVSVDLGLDNDDTDTGETTAPTTPPPVTTPVVEVVDGLLDGLIRRPGRR